jgi:1,2-diacylglycerol-3-alpha-glucose alpha-1,2-galactosyltransferase
MSFSVGPTRQPRKNNENKLGVIEGMIVNIVSESAFTVQGHGVHTAFLENCAILRKLEDVDLRINSVRKSDIIHIHTVGPFALVHLLFGRGKKVVTAHLTPDALVGSITGAERLYPWVRRYLAWFYNRANAVLAVSDEVLDKLKSLGVVKPLYLTTNTIDAAQFRPSDGGKESARRQLGIDAHAFVVLGVGQIQPRKRVSSFVECARLLPDYQFIWAGDLLFGRLSSRFRDMRRLVQDAPDNVTFLGGIERDLLAQYYRAADLFFFPSAHETFGMVVIEAAAASLPLLLRDLSQYRYTFLDAYVPGDEASYVELINRFATDGKYRRYWQTRSSKLAEKYDSNNSADQLMSIYRAVLRI